MIIVNDSFFFNHFFKDNNKIIYLCIDCLSELLKVMFKILSIVYIIHSGVN